MKYLSFLLIVGCTTSAEEPSYPVSMIDKAAMECARQATDLYGDLCAESSVGYESMKGMDAHFEGVKCGANFVARCWESEIHE